MRATWLVIALWGFAQSAAEAREVDLELVLAVDVSSSISRDEYLLQVTGLAAAFRSPEVVAAIRNFAPRGIAVTLLQWASIRQERQTVPWRHLRDESSAQGFAAEIEGMRRIGHEGVTAIAAAILAARRLFAANGFEGARRVIDVSGDGPSNQGPEIGPVRRRVAGDGITINGLPISNEQPRLVDYYRRNVIAGPGAFVQEAADYTDFARAIRAKLVREISGAGLAAR